MKFNKQELLKIYVAMGNAVDFAHSNDSGITQEFEILMEKIKNALVK